MLAPSRRHESSSVLRREPEGIRGIHISAGYLTLHSPAACVLAAERQGLCACWISHDGDWE